MLTYRKKGTSLGKYLMTLALLGLNLLKLQKYTKKVNGPSNSCKNGSWLCEACINLSGKPFFFFFVISIN